LGIEMIFKIAAIGILTAMINQILVSTGKSEIAMLTNLASLLIVLTMILSMIGHLFDSVKSLFNLF